jgi:8-oxo-dGTP pyrophosphatase MutT (NUDIX family)
MDVKKMREMFAAGVATWFDMEFMPMGKLVHGVSFVPVHLYASGGGDGALVGRPCVVLGRERAGPYAGVLNFVGGKIEDQNMRYRGEDTAKVLFDEVLEEFHLALTPALFGDMLLKVHTVPFADGVSLVFVVHLKGVSRGVWAKEHAARLATKAPWKFVEFDSIEHVPLVDLSRRKDVSKYVGGLAAEMVASGGMFAGNKGVHRAKFMTAEVRAGGKITVK